MSEESTHPRFELQVLCMVILMITCVIFTHLMEVKKFRYLHESAFSIFIGMVSSLILGRTGIITNFEFNAESFFTVILPPIIFAAGYNLRKKEFFDNLKYILLYGVLGTFINFGVLSAISYSLGQTDIFIDKNLLDLPDYMLMACVLASTDTVAALTLVKPEKYPRLNAILFGEGVVNDAVSILLFNTVKSTLTKSEIGSEAILQLLGNFLYLSIISIIIGVIFALALAFVFKRYHSFSEAPLIETCLVMLVGYSAYLIPEILHLSGIMALFSCGMVLSHYAYQNLSETSQKGTTLTFNALSFLSETFVFLYLGATVTYVDMDQFPFFFTLMMIIAVFLARILAIFLPPAVIFIVRRREINLLLKELKVICYGGLVRGAISFALAYKILAEAKTDEELKKDKTILDVCMGVVLFTTFVLTIMLQTFSSYIGLDKDETDITIEEFRQFLVPHGNRGGDKTSNQKADDSEQGIEFTFKNILSSNTIASPAQSEGTFKKQWKKIEEKIMLPLFVKEEDHDTTHEKRSTMSNGSNLTDVPPKESK